MVEMDSWCPSCGYSAEPGTRFCGGCGYQLGPGGDASPAGSATAAVQAPAPFHGYPPPGAPSAPPPPMGAPVSAPPPPSGTPLPYPPPPAATTVQPPLSDTMDRMLRPQGLFQNRLFQNAQQVPASWQQPQAAAPVSYPAGGQYPPGSPYPPGPPYPPGAPFPPGGQYPPADGYQQAAAPQAWGAAPTGGITAVPTGGMAALPPGLGAAPGQPGAGYPADGQYPPGVPANGYSYQHGQYAGPQYGNGQYGADQYGQTMFPPPGPYGPGVQFGPDGMPLAGGGGQPGSRSRLPFKRPRGKMVPVAVGGGLAVIVVAALLLAMHGGSSSNNAGNGTAGGTPTASASGTSALTQQQAATALSSLLAQSGKDHAAVNAAVGNVEACGQGLSHDAQVFSTAAGNRLALLAKLAQLPGRAALSPAMISDLTTAWQASATVDADLAKWAAGAASHCRKGNLKDPNYTATIPFDSKATNGKIAFVRLWNPLAHKDGLPTYQSAEL